MKFYKKMEVRFDALSLKKARHLSYRDIAKGIGRHFTTVAHAIKEVETPSEKVAEEIITYLTKTI
jgi:cyanate lyase